MNIEGHYQLREILDLARVEEGNWQVWLYWCRKIGWDVVRVLCLRHIREHRGGRCPFEAFHKRALCLQGNMVNGRRHEVP